MATLFSRATSLQALTAAWADVSERRDDEVSDSIARFRENADERLAKLAAQIADGTYRPSGLFEVVIPKEDGDPRVLQVPTVRDRVVERAVLNVVAPHVDPLLGPSSFAYRAGISVADAVQAVAHWREQGHRWVLRADIADCFPSMPRRVAFRMMTAALPETSLDDLIESLMWRDAAERGVPQGTSLSPLAANLVLTRLDGALLDRGFPIVRFADDFVVLCRDEAEGWEAARIATEALRGVRMTLSAEKTEVMSFEHGFTFLGEDFGPVFPPVLDDHRVPEPTKRVVFVGAQGSRLRKSQGRLLVESRGDETLLDVPLGHVERLVLFGSVGLSAGVRAWAFANGVEAVFLSRKGNYIGSHFGVNSGTKVRRLRAQIATADDDERALGFARVAVAAKLAHQMTVLRRFPSSEHADDGREAIAQIDNCLKLTRLAQTRSELMGVEGAGAQVYFGHFGMLVPEPLRFAHRSRRPPMDVVNAALGYGYAMLLGECVAALVAAGMDPAIGLLHGPEDRRPSLALDLMEEFRPYVVDQVVLELTRRKSLRTEHGRLVDKAGVLLTKQGKVALVDGYERRMLRETSGAIPGFRGSIRRHLYRQAQRLATYVENPDAGWEGLAWR
ncbi:CRISPR-associated endonuclease Cas1 [Microbacterium sp.]|uniref:CRISPR-associated endonuclease Cas1 n=1 Tax=Microbacterium sp. TaxID=51671 RepID=UPI0039E5004C